MELLEELIDQIEFITDKSAGNAISPYEESGEIASSVADAIPDSDPIDFDLIGESYEVLSSQMVAQTDLLSDIQASVQSLEQTSYLFNPSSTQAIYFRGVMSGHPNWDYWCDQDSQNSYIMYYAPKLEKGKSAHMIHIYRTNNNVNYSVAKEDSATVPTLYSTGLQISNLYDDTARFDGLEQSKSTFLIGFILCIVVGYTIIRNILFR